MPTGLRAAFGAGFGFARAEGEAGEPGYLAVTAGFHNTTHKHADELSFELFDRGAGIVSDTGLHDKDPGPVRDFVVSNRAHSTLVVDGLDLRVDDPGEAYGSALTAAGEGEGWYALEGRNPQLAAQEVAHHRLFVYRPGEALVIVDRVESPLPHTYTRYLHLGPEIEVEPEAESVGISAGALRGEVFDLSEAEMSRSQARGQEEPMQGFTSPRFRAGARRQPRR